VSDFPNHTDLDAFRTTFNRWFRAWLGVVEAGWVERFPEIAPALRTLAEHLRRPASYRPSYTRPFLVAQGHAIAGGARADAALRLGGAIELVHAYLLIHDDLIDQSPLRSGAPTLHVRYGQNATAHAGWSQALLAGNLTAELSSLLLDEIGRDFALDADVTLALQQRLSEIKLSENAGQLLDVQLAYTPLEALREDDVLQLYRLKTAAYTTEGPLALGALLADADETLLQALEEVGRALGEAYQALDDLKGAFGDEAELGKPVTSDLQEGKRTLLLCYAWRDGTAEQRTALEELMGSDCLDAFRRVLDDTGAREEAIRFSLDRLGSARERLSGLSNAAGVVALADKLEGNAKQYARI